MNNVYRQYKTYLNKRAGLAADVIGTGVGAVGGGFGVGGIDPLGLHTGMNIDPPTLEQMAHMDAITSGSFIPGGGMMRLQRKRTGIAALRGGGKQPNHELIGARLQLVGGLLAGALLGAGIGALNDDPAFGVAVGAGAGAGTILGAHLIGAVSAAVTDRRTDAEQTAYEKGSPAGNYLIPGASTYNRYKSLGHAQGAINAYRAKKGIN